MKIAILPMLPLYAAFAYAQPAPLTPAPQKVDFAVTTQTQSALVRLGGQLMIAGRAYEYDRQIADDIGPRLTGSANYVKAVDWAANEFTRIGLANVHREAWEIAATWEPENVGSARLIAPHPQRLHLESEGWSPSTPPNGVQGPLYYIKDLDVAAIKSDSAHIKGSIALIDRHSLAAHRADGYGKIFEALDELGNQGAKAVVLGLGTTNNAPSMIGIGGFTATVAKIPFGNLGSEDTLLVMRLLERGPVEIEFSFTNHIREHVKVNNVVAEIPGRDQSGEYVLIGGHLDSWHPGTGAQDNGTGASSVLAIAEAIKASGLTPRRTIRFVLFGGEEEGLLGSLNYARNHAADAAKCVGVFVTDSGAEAPKGWMTLGREDSRQAIAVLKPWLSQLGASGISDEGQYTFSTDEAPFLVQGVPSFILWTDSEKYGLLHHKPSDTFDKVNQRDLSLGVAVVGITAYAFADSASALKHYSTSEMEDQLKAIKSYSEYKDMLEHKLF